MRKKNKIREIEAPSIEKNEKDKLKEWNLYFKESGYKLVKRNYYWKILGFFLVLGILGFLGYMVYAIQYEKLEIKPSFNSSFEGTALIDNQYDNNFDNQVSNQYEHKIYVNNTNYINIVGCPNG